LAKTSLTLPLDFQTVCIYTKPLDHSSLAFQKPVNSKKISLQEFEALIGTHLVGTVSKLKVGETGIVMRLHPVALGAKE
jgi:hypothetical protein